MVFSIKKNISHLVIYGLTFNFVAKMILIYKPLGAPYDIFQSTENKGFFPI